MRTLEESREPIEVIVFSDPIEAGVRSKAPFQSLDDLILAIEKLQDPAFDASEHLRTLSENAAIEIITRTPSIMLAAIEYKKGDNIEYEIDGINYLKLLTYGHIIMRECMKSEHPSATVLGAYLAGYDIGLIACIHNRSPEKILEIRDKSMFDPTILAGILHVDGYNGVAQDVKKIIFEPIPFFDDISPPDVQRFPGFFVEDLDTNT